MKLNQFLVKAKINTYASSDDDIKELEFEEGEFKYKDQYFGFNPFIGEEIVWQNGEAIWGMNYYGKVLDNSVPEKEIYNFLREALRQVSEDQPFRGPKRFEKNNFLYINKIDGSINNFKGVEEIFYKDQKVHEVNYYGGKIK